MQAKDGSNARYEERNRAGAAEVRSASVLPANASVAPAPSSKRLAIASLAPRTATKDAGAALAGLRFVS